MDIAQTSALQPNSSDEYPWWEDEILCEVYATRDAYAAEHGNDIRRIFEDLKRGEATSTLRRLPSAQAPPE